MYLLLFVCFSCHKSITRGTGVLQIIYNEYMYIPSNMSGKRFGRYENRYAKMLLEEAKRRRLEGAPPSARHDDKEDNPRYPDPDPAPMEETPPRSTVSSPTPDSDDESNGGDLCVRIVEDDFEDDQIELQQRIEIITLNLSPISNELQDIRCWVLRNRPTSVSDLLKVLGRHRPGVFPRDYI